MISFFIDKVCGKIVLIDVYKIMCEILLIV